MEPNPPNAIAPGDHDGSALVIFEDRIPGTRRVGTFVVVLVGTALLVAGSGDPFVSIGALLVGGWMLVHDLFSVFGWEHVILTETDLRIERRLFGLAVKRLRLDRAGIQSIDFVPRPRGLGRFQEGEDRDQDVWGFDSGPIVVTTESAYHRFGQGYLKDRDAARGLVERLRILSPPSNPG